MIRIEFIQAELARWFRALDRVETYSKLWIENWMQRKSATDYYQLVAQNLVGGKYAGGYAKYDSNRDDNRYGDWKKKYFPGRGFWQLKGDLLKNLTMWKVDKGYRAGIPPGVMDSGGKSWFGTGGGGKRKEIVMYGGILEKTRPLFGPTMKEYAASGWQKRGKEALKGIGRHWA